MSNIKKQGHDCIYESSFKVAVAREYLTSPLGYGRLAKKYGLKPGTVRFFVRWYRSVYEQAQLQPTADNQPALPIQEQRELKGAHLKITALEMLIENASKELGIDLVKKYGTKQSGK